MKKRFFTVLCVFLVFSISYGKYSGGDGSAEDPFQIATPNDLNSVGDYPEDWDKHFILTADINMVEYTYTTALIAPDTSSSSGFQGISFTGVFDGNDHIIGNLTIDTAGAGNNYLGLFGEINGGTISNLGVENCNITGGDNSEYLGSLCGKNNQGTISNCYSSGAVSGDDNIGGLCGKNIVGTIVSCYTTGSVNGGIDSRSLGGLCGDNSLGTIISCYSTSSVNGGIDSRSLGGLCGDNFGTIISCYSTSSVNGGIDSRSLGGLIGTNVGGISNCYATGSISGDTYLGGFCGNNGGGISNCYATGPVVGVEYLGGFCGYNYSGSISNCYFLHPFDGGGPDNDIGFPLIDRLMKKQSSFSGWDFVGETANGTSSFWIMKPDCYPMLFIFDDDFLPHEFAGTGTEVNPYRICDATDLGAVWQQINCHFRLENNIDLTGIQFSVPVIPSFGDNFDGSDYTISNVNISGDGFFGFFGHLLSSAYVKNLGLENINITVGNNSDIFGGFCGLNYKGTIENCHAEGSVTSGDDSTHIGGLCGWNFGTIKNCYSEVSITSGDESIYIGGLCGRNDHSEITNCYSTSSVDVSFVYEMYGGHCGGLCGWNYSGTIRNCYSTGSVNGPEAVGGLCGGNHEGTIENCYAESSVTGSDYGIGGLCGDSHDGTVSNCYASGSVYGWHGSSYVGGLCGSSSGTMTNCYATSSVMGDNYYGGLCGSSSGTITSCFWDIETSGITFSDGGIGKTTSEMQTKSTFIDAGWDLVNESINGPNDIWTIKEGINYPEHVWPLVQYVDWDGVDFLDYGFLADHWMLTDCNDINDCNSTDLDFSGAVNINDVNIFTNYWLFGK